MVVGLCVFMFVQLCFGLSVSLFGFVCALVKLPVSVLVC
jgi:hypothetical protein